MSDSPQRNKIVNLGLLLAAGHFGLFLLSAQLAQQGQGWAGVFVWPVWLLIDFPVSLLHFLMHQRRIDLWVQAMSSGSIVWAYLLYSPYPTASLAQFGGDFCQSCFINIAHPGLTDETVRTQKKTKK